MNKFNTLLETYGESHQNKTNKLIHWICVPAIFFSLVGLISIIPFPWEESLVGAIKLNWAFVALILILLYYISLSVSISIGMTLFSFLCIYLCDYINSFDYPHWIYVGIFVESWILQFVGHHIEGKKPSFLQDIQFLLIGPAWLMHFLYKKIKIPY